VVAVASVTAFIGDQILFWLGRWRGHALLARWPSIQAKAVRVHELIDRYHMPMIIGMRFAYGLRIPGPILIGMSPLSAARFAVINAFGAVLWACVIGGLGWLSGAAAETVLGDIKHIEVWLFVGLVAVAATIWLIRRLLRK
jgi:membrane protein DedA with SNARE-associated domain